MARAPKLVTDTVDAVAERVAATVADATPEAASIPEAAAIPVAAPIPEAVTTPAVIAKKASVWSKEQMDKATKSYAELTAFSKEAVNDVVASSKATAEGLKAISAELTAFAKATAEENVAVLKKLMAAKSLSEVIALHTAYTNSSLDAYLAHSRKIGEATVNTVKQAVQPLNARLADAAARVERSAAA